MTTTTISLSLVGAGLFIWFVILLLRRSKSAPKAPAKNALEALIEVKHTKPESPIEAPKPPPGWLEKSSKSPKKPL